MPGKRSHFKRSLHLPCPKCQLPLRRLNSCRYTVFAEDAADIRSALGIPRSRAKLLASQGPVTLRSQWVEEFLCPDHGRMWLKVQRTAVGAYTACVPEAALWRRLLHTIDPDHTNPSVSKYTLHHSRQAAPNLLQRFYQ